MATELTKEKINAEIAKVFAGIEKTRADTTKISAEIIKIGAENAKIDAENKWYPAVVVATVIFAFVGIANIYVQMAN